MKSEDTPAPADNARRDALGEAAEACRSLAQDVRAGHMVRAGAHHCLTRIQKLMDAPQDSKLARLERALTPDGDTKAAYSGEFKWKSPGGRTTYTVPWDVIKQIMEAVRKFGG